MSEEIKEQVAEVENTEKCDCGCGCQDAAAAPAGKKLSKGNLVRIIVWSVVAVIVVLFLCFRGTMIEYLGRGQAIEQINKYAERELGYKPFKVEALGNYKFQVICQEKPADHLKQYNVVDFEVKDGIVQEASDKDKNSLINMKGVKAPVKAEEKTEEKK